MLFCRSESSEETRSQSIEDIVKKIVVEEGVKVTQEQKVELAKQILNENDKLSAWFAAGDFRKMACYMEMKDGALTVAEPEYQKIECVSEVERYFRKLKDTKSRERKEGQWIELEMATRFIFIEEIQSQIYYYPDKAMDKIDLVAHEYFRFYIRVKQGDQTISNANGSGDWEHKHRAGCPWDG